MNLFTRIICLALLLSALAFVALKVPVSTQSVNTVDPVVIEAS